METRDEEGGEGTLAMDFWPPSSQQAFFTAIRSGDLDSVRRIVDSSGGNISSLMNIVNEEGETALFVAAENNLEDVVRYLAGYCNFGTAAVKSKAGITALHAAAKRGYTGEDIFMFRKEFFSGFGDGYLIGGGKLVA